MLTVKTIIETVFEKWSSAVSEKLGDNYSMENSETVSKLPYASLYFISLSSGASALDGREAAVTPTVQVDIYTTGQKALTSAYEIDELSHEALLGMRFRRTAGPELIQSTDPSIKRLTSRYSRLVGYSDTL